MSADRFYLPPACIQIHTNSVAFPEERRRQIIQVLRFQPGQEVSVFDNSGTEYRVRLDRIQKTNVSGTILEKKRPAVEAAVFLELWVCASRREKLEWILQKCTEIGASAFRFLVSERSLIRTETDLNNRSERWQQIVMEATEQSGRVQLPDILQPMRYAEAFALPQKEETVRLLAWEQEHTASLESILPTACSKVIALIGPEGGISPAEYDLATQADFRPFSLGRRILRMETAAMATTALIVHHYESREPFHTA